MASEPPAPGNAALITRVNLALSILLVLPLGWLYLRLHSQLALAQAADSAIDSLTAVALLYSIRLSAQPADEDHPRGHQRAEPVAALMVAVMAGVLAVEVFREAVVVLIQGRAPQMAWHLAAVFAFKVVAKAILFSVAGRQGRRLHSPALRALQVDARNDVFVGLLALVGFFATRYASPGWDAWLAMPMALWIGVSGVDLARENIGMLMGQAAPAERSAELVELASQIPGVDSIHHVMARHEGAQLEIIIHVVVDENLSVRQAHDIAEAVELRLEQEPDVHSALVHVDVDPEDPHAGRP